MEQYYSQVIARIMEGDIIKATKFVSPKLIIRATRSRYRGRLTRKGDNIDITLTIGRPNYAEREFIKVCQKANEPFPLKKVQLKLYNPPKKKLTRNTPLTN